MTLIKPPSHAASTLQKQRLWAPIYSGVDQIISMVSNNRALMVPFGDPNHEDSVSAPTKVTTRGAEQVDFTYTNSGRHLWATALGYEGPGQIPVLFFDGSTDWMETPDAAFWNDTAGTNEVSYNFAMWVNVVASAVSHALWSKSPFTGETTGTDWISILASNERFFTRIFDDSADAYIGSQSSVLADGWHHLVATKHDDAATSASVITYIDGAADRADNTVGTYVAQEDGTTVVRIGAESDGGSPNGLAIAGGPNGPIFEPVGAGAVWTPDQVKELYQLQAPQLIEGWTAY